MARPASIQIQLLLKLNCIQLKLIVFVLLYSNTTLVKVKYFSNKVAKELKKIQIQLLLKLNVMAIKIQYSPTNSNTTLVKVKYL